MKTYALSQNERRANVSWGARRAQAGDWPSGSFGHLSGLAKVVCVALLAPSTLAQPLCV